MWQKIKLILKSVREYKIYAIFCPIVMIGEVAMECCIPWGMSNLLNALNPEDLETQNAGLLKPLIDWMSGGFTGMGMDSRLAVILPWAIILLLMAIVSIICGILGGVLASTASAGLAKNLRDDLYKKIESFSFANIDKFSSASLITRMTTDVNNAQQSFQMCIRIVVRAPLMMIFSIIMAFITANGNPMAWIFIGLLPVIIFGLFLIAKCAMPIFRRVFKKYDALNQSVQENISGIRVVKSFVREEHEQDKFNSASDGMAKEFIKAEKILALNNPLMNTSIHLSNILVIGFGSYLIIKSATKKTIDGVDTVVYSGLTPSQMTALITYGIQILTSLMMISMIIVMLIMSLEAIRRIGEVLEEEPTIENPENPIMELDDGSITFSNVTFKYSDKAERNSLENINLNIKSGQFIGILGSTGSGKSSLINLISRLYDTTEGEVIVGGHNVKDYDLISLRDNVAVVLQKNVLFSGTIASNLRWGNESATLEEMEHACGIACATEFINKMPDGYETKIEQGGTNVSGGQKQRLCIARAILKKPKILILDDSTSAVDTKTDRLIRKGLKEVIPSTTKIVISQRISSIESADQIIIMDNGKINAIGTHEELLKNNAIYQDVYFTQNTEKKKGGK